MTQTDKSKHQTIQEVTLGSRHGLVDLNDFPAFTFDVFASDYLAANDMLTGKASGRGTTWFFAHNNKEYVLRSYLRGGFVAKFLKDQFFHLAYSRSRAWKEFKLLQALQEKDLPAPRPVAAMVKRSGLVFRSFLITERIPNSRDLFQILQEGEIDASTWRKIGTVIAKFHEQHVFHHDLNIHNIMLDDQGKVWLIDFDKCEFRSPGKWRMENINRLHRSFNKELNKTEGLHGQLADFDALLQGYNAS